MAIFTGAGVAIVTPFNEDGSINYDRLDELIEFHCAHKTDSIVICGTTGESATMTEEEHMQCVKFTIDRVNKRVPVIAGTGSNCTVCFWLHLITIKQHRTDLSDISVR